MFIEIYVQSFCNKQLIETNDTTVCFCVMENSANTNKNRFGNKYTLLHHVPPLLHVCPLLKPHIRINRLIFDVEEEAKICFRHVCVQEEEEE